MGGIELRDDRLVVDREPNDLDRLALDFSAMLTDLGIDHVFVSGYVAILAGRARATQDIDVFLEHCDETQIETLVDRLEAADFWGPAMPLASSTSVTSTTERHSGIR